MTLAAYNARRKSLKRLEHVGWIQHRRNLLKAFGALPQYVKRTLVIVRSSACYRWEVPVAPTMASDIRRYRLKHKFWECW